MRSILCCRKCDEVIALHSERGEPLQEALSRLRTRECSSCGSGAGDARFRCMCAEAGTGCSERMEQPSTTLLSGSLTYLCPQHMSRLHEAIEALGAAGTGPSHMPGCRAASLLGPIVAHLDYGAQMDRLVEIAHTVGTVVTDDDRRAHIWFTDCCNRPLVPANIRGRFYAVNLLQLQKYQLYLEA